MGFCNGVLLISFFAIGVAARSLNSGSPFDYMMLTFIYPTAVCRADDDTVPDSCEIPTGTPEWTIHGLWPNYENGSYPQFCPGEPRHFNKSLIAEIAVKLTLLWPNLYPTKSVESFWKHEYEKHGTCAQSDPDLDSELKYFSKVLLLHAQFDVNAALAKIGGPSATSLKKIEILEALKELTNGQNVLVHCLKDKKTGQTLLGDVRLCLNKDFTPRECPDQLLNRVDPQVTAEPPLPSFNMCPSEVIYLPREKRQQPTFKKVSPGNHFL